MAVETITAICQPLGARVALEIRWQGAALDRLLDERHAALSGATASRLRSLGWTVEVEVSYSHFGERGSIDLLAWHPISATVLTVEIKTELASVEEMLRRLDAKTRLARRIAVERFDYRPHGVARLVVVADSSTARRQVDRHCALLEIALPDRGEPARAWLTRPAGTMSGLIFLSANDGARRRQASTTPRRVRIATGLRQARLAPLP
jgi:hypothetical protein